MQNLCGQTGDNTGIVLCDRQRGIPRRLLLGGAVFEPEDYATPDLFQAALKANVKLPMGNGDKLFPLPEITGTTKQTDALKTASSGYGLKQVTIEGRPAYSYQVICGQALFQRLRSFNRQIIPVFTEDDQQLIWGFTDSLGNFSGEIAQVFVSGNEFGDGSALFCADISIAYQSAGDFHDNSKYVPLNFNLSEAKGLLSVTLSEYLAHTTNTYRIAALVKTAQLGKSLNVELDFGTELEDEAMWIATTGAGALAITSVTLAAGKGWVFVFDNTAYTALPSGTQIFLSMVDSTTLDDNDITGIENVAPIVLTKP